MNYRTIFTLEHDDGTAETFLVEAHKHPVDLRDDPAIRGSIEDYRVKLILCDDTEFGLLDAENFDPSDRIKAEASFLDRIESDDDLRREVDAELEKGFYERE